MSSTITTKAYSAATSTTPLAPTTIERREPTDHDVLIDIKYCGVCHSDLHQIRDEWGGSIFPMVPGHEIVGIVSSVGKHVKKFAVGDTVGVGCMVDSCRTCGPCKQGLEQNCDTGSVYTYNGRETYRQDAFKNLPTYGGYSTKVTVDEAFVVRVPTNLPLDLAAPLLCAGITTYSPLRHFGIKQGNNVAIVGLGGLGHMGVKFAKALGARVTVLSHSESKKQSALALGADDFIVTKDPAVFQKHAGQFDFILDTVSAKHDYNSYLNLLRLDGTLCLVGVPPSSEVNAFALMRRKILTFSGIGGIPETQEMLDFCGKHNITSEVEVIPIQKINQAFERLEKGDVLYRFVIDIASLEKETIENPGK